MRVLNSMQGSRNRAAEALKSLLHQVSQIKLTSIDSTSSNPDLKVDILAEVEVHGHRHTLVCKVNASGRPDHVLVALKEFEELTGKFDDRAMPVIIAPHISEEARALCGANKAGFLDLEGNAHLELGDLFIFRRTRPQQAQSTATPQSSAILQTPAILSNAAITLPQRVQGQFARVA